MMKSYSSFLLVTFMLTTAGFAEGVLDEFFEIEEQLDGKMILRAHATDENIEDVIRRFEKKLERRLNPVGEGGTCPAKPPPTTETATATTTATAATTKEVTFANTKPPAPEKVANLIVQVNGTSLTPSWNSSTGVTSYEIEIKIGSTSILKIPSATNGKEITNDAIKPATMYNISVVAVIGDQRSDATTKPFNTTFNAPNVTIDEVLQNTFQLSWSEVNGTSFYEYKCTPKDTEYRFTLERCAKIDKLTANTEYTCSVRGTNGSIEGDPGSATQTTCRTYETTSDCKLAYNEKCFKFVPNDTSITLDTASRMCEAIQFKLGKITDDCMFYALKKYHENEKFGGTGEQYWTGSQITEQNVDDYGRKTGYISNNWRSDSKTNPVVGQYITIKAQDHKVFGTTFGIVQVGLKQNDDSENKLDGGAFCVKSLNKN